MSALRKLPCFWQVSRNISSSSKNLYPKDMARFKELQRQFQVDDGVPIHLKKGGSDKFIFSSICLATGVCFIMALHVCYTLIYPPKNN